MVKIHLWPDKLNSMSLEEIKELQEEKLRRQIKYCYDNSDYYKRKFREVGAEPEDIRTVEDLRKLPVFMRKEDERKSQEESKERYGHPFGMHLCCPVEDIIMTGTTSGTTGLPTFSYSQTEYDIEINSSIIASIFHSLNLGKGDRIFFVFPLGTYATTGLLPGIRKAGILPIDIDIRAGTDAIMTLLKETKPNVMLTGPSIAEYYISVVKEKLGMDVKDLGFKCLILTGEMGCGIKEFKEKIESAYGCRWYDYWGPSMTTRSISCDSDEYHGLHHVCPTYSIAYEDLIDPITKKPLEIKNGVIGEYVATHLDKKACPYIKYATGDIIQVFTEPCPNCGFRGLRAKPIGRADDMLTVKGVNVYPGPIKDIIMSFMPKVTGEMRIVLESPPPRVNKLKLKIEYGRGMENKLVDLTQDIVSKLKSNLRVSPEIEWVPPYSLKRFSRKPPIFEKKY